MGLAEYQRQAYNVFNLLQHTTMSALSRASTVDRNHAPLGLLNVRWLFGQVMDEVVPLSQDVGHPLKVAR